ncbi:MAG: O-antigen ligase family protein [Victivallales bacterium]|nr:O-antigen ligase family protein [Victivallales bacterium]
MKYLFFFTAVLGIVPGTLFLICFRRYTRWAVFGLFLPLLMFNSTAINFFSHETYRGTSRGMEISLVYFVALILLLTLTFFNGYQRLFPEMGSKLYLCYFLYSCLSVFNAENVLFSFFELWKMIMIFMVFLAVYHYLEFNFGDVDIIMYGFLSFIIPCGLLVVWQHFHGVYQAYGVFPHRNSMAMAMNMLGMLFLAYCLTNPGFLLDKIFLFAFFLCGISVMFSYSRGALFCLPFGVVLVIGLSFVSRPSFRNVYIISAMVLIVLVLFWLFLPKIIERFEKAPEASKQTRIELAESAANMIKDCPIVGVGINNWGIKINPPYLYSTRREDRSEDSKDAIVETVYLLIGAECGIPCLLLFILLFVYYLFSCIHLMFCLRNTRYYYYPVGVFGGMINIMLQSALEWVLKQQMNFILLMAMFAVVSFLNKNYKKLVKREQETRAREHEALASASSVPPAQNVVS